MWEAPARGSCAGTVLTCTGRNQPSNVLITPQGGLWNDLEDVSLGPREWDVGWLPEADLAQFEPLNQNLLSAFHYLRSLCASVWCWARYDVSAAELGKW
jgi:hypothetical protein